MDISGSPVPAERPVELRRSRRRLLGSGYLSGGLAVGALSLLAGFIALPILSLVIWTVSNSAWQEMTSPAAVDALLLSARTTAISMTIILLVGTPAAYVLARYDFPGKRIVNTLVDLPAVLPPSAAGIALPLGFGQIEQGIEEAALVDGGGPITVFLKVTIPLAFPALVAGAVTAWARALGEFGGTIIFAGNVQGVTQTIPLAIFSELERDFDAAVALSVLVLGFAFIVILAARYLTRKAAEVRG